MKVVVTGKGGTGKTTVAGAVCRHLARRGRAVVAVDADPNPNLGLSLGLPPPAVERMEPILNVLLASGFTHHDPKPQPEELLERFAVLAPDGVRLVATGRIERPTDSCLCCGSHLTTREFFGSLPDEGRIVVADLEAGLNDLIWARPGPRDAVVVVADPSAKALDIARRASGLVAEMGVRRVVGVANRAGDDGDRRRLEDVLGAEALVVPEDPAVDQAEEAGVAPFDHDPGSPAVRAVAWLADWLEAVADGGPALPAAPTTPTAGRW